MGLLSKDDFDYYLSQLGAYFAIMLRDNPDDLYKELYSHYDAVREHIQTLEKTNGWISVKDRLPENDNEVITAYKIDDEKTMKNRKGKLFVKTGNWTGYRWISVWDEYKAYSIEEEVLYWMPLPEPPKEET